MAIGLRLGCELDTDVATSAATVLDDHLLADRLGQFRRDQAADEVGAATGYERHDEADRLGRPLLCGCRDGKDQGQRQHGRGDHGEAHRPGNRTLGHRVRPFWNEKTGCTERYPLDNRHPAPGRQLPPARRLPHDFRTRNVPKWCVFRRA
jgi:hypothetical protein